MIDPDATAAKGSHGALDWWSCSPDGEHVVFGLSGGGSENSIAHVVVTATGALLSESIDRTEYANTSWSPDGAGFFYNRLKAGMAADSLDKYKLSACWFHRLNTDPASDIKALAQGMSPVVAIADIDFPGVQATAGSDILIGAVVSGVQNELALYTASLSAFGRAPRSGARSVRRRTR